MSRCSYVHQRDLCSVLSSHWLHTSTATPSLAWRTGSPFCSVLLTAREREGEGRRGREGEREGEREGGKKVHVTCACIHHYTYMYIHVVAYIHVYMYVHIHVKGCCTYRPRHLVYCTCQYTMEHISILVNKARHYEHTSILVSILPYMPIHTNTPMYTYVRTYVHYSVLTPVPSKQINILYYNHTSKHKTYTPGKQRYGGYTCIAWDGLHACYKCENMYESQNSWKKIISQNKQQSQTGQHYT